jgi:hypothetical protein
MGVEVGLCGLGLFWLCRFEVELRCGLGKARLGWIGCGEKAMNGSWQSKATVRLIWLLAGLFKAWCELGIEDARAELGLRLG